MQHRLRNRINIREVVKPDEVSPDVGEVQLGVAQPDVAL